MRTTTLPESLLHPHRLRLFAVTLAAAVALAAGATGLFSALEERSADPLWQSASTLADTAERRVVIAEIDEKSLAELGPWPWPRERMAALADALAGYGARTQLFDVVFPEARPGDEALAAAQRRHPVHVGQLFSPGADASRVASLSGAIDGQICDGRFPVAGGYIGNTPALAHQAGHITPTLDTDGTVRRIAPVLCHQQHAYPALALAGLASLVPGQALALDYQEGYGLLAPHAWLALPGQGLRLPLDRDGNTRLAFTLPRAALSATPVADILAGRSPRELLDGAIVLVGATAFGLSDTVSTPLDGNTAGVEVHARLLAGLLDQRLPYAPRGAALFQALFCALGALALLWLASRQQRLHVATLPAAGLALAVLAYALHATLLLEAGLWVGWMTPAVFLALAGLGLGSAEFARTRLERQRLYQNLASYLPRQVAAQIALHEPVGTIEVERREISVLFADLRNFSAYCEARPPEEAAAVLHTFFTTAQRVVSRHGGIIEEFTGDAIMAIWNAPTTCPDHPRHALAAAYELDAEITALLPPEAPPGLEPLALGMGLESGKALVGSVGAADRRTHTALGETVSIASRLQAMSAELAAAVVVGPGAAARLPDARLTCVGDFLLEGLQIPRTLYIPAPAARAEDAPKTARIRLVA